MAYVTEGWAGLKGRSTAIDLVISDMRDLAEVLVAYRRQLADGPQG